MKKIALIVQRYGVDVNGGAEHHCRLLAERLKTTYEVDVLTSCALEYRQWANYYPAGASDVNGIRVVRFPTLQNRDEERFSRMTHRLTKQAPPGEQKWVTTLKAWGRPLIGKSVARYSTLWAHYQGPYVPGLVRYLKQQHEQYAVLVFFTYLYYPTIEGLKVAPHKAILIPTAHDEPPIYLPVFKKLFSLPKAILYNSLSEKRFVNRLFHNELLYSDIVGVAVEPMGVSTGASAASLLGSDSPYLIYIGRIDPAKGCAVLFDYFIRFKENNPSSLKLVLVGQPFMPVPDHPDLQSVGFVDEAVKLTLLQEARALVIPSLYESLSMVTLESFSQGIPVIANGDCEVLSDHINGSQAGVLYRNYADFDQAVHQILTLDRPALALKAKQYVKQQYTWERVLAKFTKTVDYVIGN